MIERMFTQSLEGPIAEYAKVFLSRATRDNPEALEMVEDWYLNRSQRLVSPEEYENMKEINAITMGDCTEVERYDMLLFQTVVYIFSLTDEEANTFLDCITKYHGEEDEGKTGNNQS
jgi:hypothetical protein